MHDSELMPCIMWGQDEDLSTCICGGILHAWAVAAKDPAANVATWLWKGAPAGLEAHFTDIGHTLPAVDPDATMSRDELQSC